MRSIYKNTHSLTAYQPRSDIKYEHSGAVKNMHYYKRWRTRPPPLQTPQAASTKVDYVSKKAKNEQEAGKEQQAQRGKRINQIDKSSCGQLIHAYIGEFDEITLFSEANNVKLHESARSPLNFCSTLFIDSALYCKCLFESRCIVRHQAE